jgi:type I restriction enzyme S subunit
MILLYVEGDQSFHEVKLKEIAVINYGYTESANHAEVGPKFLRITDIQFGKVDWSTVPYCPISNADEEKYSLRDGDLVFARTGATTGKSFLLSDPPRSVCASYLIRVRPDSRKVLPEYLYLYFQSGRYWLDVKGGMSGTAQGGFNSTKLGALSVRIPDLQSQQIIVDKARELLQISEDLQLVLSQREEIAEKFALSIMATSA